MKRVRLSVQALDARDLPSATLVGGVLTVDLVGARTHTVSVDPAGADVRVTEDGAVHLFARADVRSLVMDGAANGRNVLQNNTDIDSVLLGGNLADQLSGGTGSNYIKPGPGNDVVHAVSGSNTIDVAGQGADHVFTTAGAAVTADRLDRVVTFFAAGREAGSGFVGVENGVLYIAPTDHNGVVFVEPGPHVGQTEVLYDFDQDDGVEFQSQVFRGVRLVAYYGGSGMDIYYNRTHLPEVAHGGAGNDYLQGTRGAYSLLRGDAGDDTIEARAVRNDVGGGDGADRIELLRALYIDLVRATGDDTVTGAGRNDLMVG